MQKVKSIKHLNGILKKRPIFIKVEGVEWYLNITYESFLEIYNNSEGTINFYVESHRDKCVIRMTTVFNG